MTDKMTLGNATVKADTVNDIKELATLLRTDHNNANGLPQTGEKANNQSVLGALWLECQASLQVLA